MSRCWRLGYLELSGLHFLQTWIPKENLKAEYSYLWHYLKKLKWLSSKSENCILYNFIRREASSAVAFVVLLQSFRITAVLQLLSWVWSNRGRCGFHSVILPKHRRNVALSDWLAHTGVKQCCACSNSL